MQLVQISEPSLPISSSAMFKGGYAIGIDLGTTNSVVACVINGESKVLGSIIPSTYRNIRSIKRLMGSNEKVETDGHYLTPVEISAHILLNLKQQAENILGEAVTQAVITVPAHFDDAARNDTKAAATLAGLEVLRLINEPTAAAVAYGLDRNAEGIYLIYDFGGGTFDVSILKMQKGIFQVLATGGNSKLGGDDIDHAIMQYLKLAPTDYDIAKEAKETLAEQEVWSHKKLSLSRQELNQLVRPLIEETIQLCKETIKESNINPSELKEIVLVGGSTRLKLVKTMLSEHFKIALDNLDPDLVVAMGAAVQADALVNGSDNLLLDIMSLSIGLEVMGGMNERIIPKNSPIPSSVTKYFTTYQDGQTGIIFHIIQGEREMVSDCRSLARFELKGIPPMKAAMAKVAVTFAIDADGLLTISAREEHSGVKQVIEVKPSYGLTHAEVENMLEQAYIHAKEDMSAKALAKAILSAQGNIHNLLYAIEEDSAFIEITEKREILALIQQLQEAIISNQLDVIEDNNRILENKSSSFIQARLNRKIKQALQGETTERFSEKH